MSTVKQALLATTAIVALTLGAGAKAELVTNGGFETGDYTGWNLAYGIPVVWFYQGSYRAELGAGDHSGPYFDLRQTVSTTVGQAYDVSFDWAPWPRTEPESLRFTVSSGGINLLTLTPSGIGSNPAVFQTFNGHFVATANAATIRFLDTSASSNQLDQWLDNVSIKPSAVPIPAAVWLFGSALAGLTGVGYQRRKLLTA